MSRESKVLIGILIAVVGGMIGLFAIANNNQSASEPKGDPDKIVRDSSHKQGTGSVQLVEFGDYQCPSCGAAYPVIKQIQAAFPDKVTFYFRNFPISNIHKNALAAAHAAESASEVGKFWEMHDKLYEAQTEWSNLPDPSEKFLTYAESLGIDKVSWKKAYDEKKYQTAIDQDLADATALGVNSTPTFYLNGTKYEGKATFPELRDKINSLLGESAQQSPAATPTPQPAN